MQIRKTYSDIKPELLYDEIRNLVLKQGAIIDEKLFPGEKVSALQADLDFIFGSYEVKHH